MASLIVKAFDFVLFIFFILNEACTTKIEQNVEVF